MIDPIILTVSGCYVNILEPSVDDIDIKDIAHALSNINRYNGHTTVPYTVAEHSMRVAYLLKCQGYTPAAQLAGLLHDATEAYIGDVATPIKQLLPKFKRIERGLEKVIEEKFSVTIRNRPEVHAADLQLLASERKFLMPDTPDYPWPIIEGIDPDAFDRTCKLTSNRWGDRKPVYNRINFLRMFDRLVKDVEACSK